MNLFSTLFKKNYFFTSSINKDIRISRRFGKYTLFVNNVPQSGGEFEFMWKKILSDLNFLLSSSKRVTRVRYLPGVTFDPAQQEGDERQDLREKDLINNSLILGVGGGTAIKYLKKYFANTKITAVEIDPLMIDLAGKYFELERGAKLRIIISDASKWLVKNQNKFNLVIVDLFDGILNPQFIREEKYLKILKKLLNPDGMVIYNAHFQPNNSKEYNLLLKRSQKIFRRVEEVFSYRFNRVLVLTF